MIDKISDYLYTKIKEVHTWNRENFDKMIKWYASNGMLFAILDNDKNILAASVIRTIDGKNEKHIKDPYFNDEDQNTLYAQYLVSDDKKAKGKMFDMIIRELGMPEFVAYRRIKNDDRLTFLPANRFNQIHQRG